MKKHILFLAKEDEFILDSPRSSEEFRHRAGYNIGNWLFTSGIQNMLDESGEKWMKKWISLESDHELKSEQPFTHCIINCSNWINLNSINEVNLITRKIKRWNIPTYAIGLGAQFKNADEKLALNLKSDSFIEFINAIIQTGGTYSVRGAQTADLISRWGLERPFVFGCPSLLGHGVPKQLANDKKLICFNGDEWLYKFILIPNSFFIDQASLFHICYRQSLRTRLNSLASIKVKNRRLFGQKRIFLPKNLGSWSHQVSKAGLSVGTRIHGTIIAILNGVPAVLLYHDSRTKELADFYGIPNMNVDLIKNSEQALSLARDLCAIPTNCKERVLQNKRDFNDWCTKNSVPLSASERKISFSTKTDAPRPYSTRLEECILKLRDLVKKTILQKKT